jgi:hypothetical protein
MFETEGINFCLVMNVSAEIDKMNEIKTQRLRNVDSF